MGNKDFRVVQGGKVKSDSASNPLNSPASLAEVLQISRASAEDVVTDYHNKQYPFQLSLTAQLSVITNILISAGITDLESFQNACTEQMRKLHEDIFKNSASQSDEENKVTEMKMTVGDVEVTIDK